MEKQLRAVGSNIDQINWAMEEVAATLPRVADSAERAGRGAVRS